MHYIIFTTIGYTAGQLPLSTRK